MANALTIDIDRKIWHRRFRWLGQILRLEKDQNNKTRLLKQAVLQMEKPYPPGSILMDVPPHESRKTWSTTPTTLIAGLSGPTPSSTLNTLESNKLLPPRSRSRPARTK